MWHEGPDHATWGSRSCDVRVQIVWREGPDHATWGSRSCDVRVQIVWREGPDHVTWGSRSCDVRFQIMGIDGRCKVYPRWLNPWVIYKGRVKGRQNKGVCHFKIRRKKNVRNTYSLSQALTLTLTVTLSPNHYTMNNFGRPCTQFRLMYTTYIWNVL